MSNKIGFACKISEIDAAGQVVSIPELNTRGTTVTWLNRQSKDVAVAKLWELMQHNLEATRKAVEYVGNLEEGLRLFRLGSDILPVYTHNDWKWFWQQSDVRTFCEKGFGRVGDLARASITLLINNIIISLHNYYRIFGIHLNRLFPLSSIYA